MSYGASSCRVVEVLTWSDVANAHVRIDAAHAVRFKDMQFS